MTTSLNFEFGIGTRSHHVQLELSQFKYQEQANFGLTERAKLVCNATRCVETI